MDDKKTLKMDLSEIYFAMDDNSDEHSYYLDLETGEILFISYYMEEEEKEELVDRVDEDPDRYEQIPRAESHEGYEDMEDFIDTLENEHLAKLLQVAIRGKGAFRRFKDVLESYPEERERWFSFKDDRLRERSLEWLDDIGITLVEE